MIKKLYCIETAFTDPCYNLALEEELLRWLPADSCIVYLWQNQHTVVIGKNQNAWKECRTEQLQADGGHLVRRPSGGGAVYHDLGNLNFTFLANSGDYDVRRQLSVIMEACRAFGIPAEISGRNDLLAAGRKFSGNAFLESGGKGSHHGTLLVDVDMTKMPKYLRPSKEKMKAKGVNSVESRVVNLREFVPTLTIGDLKSELRRAAERVYGLPAQTLTEAELDGAAIETGRQKYASWEWTYGKTMEFTLSFGSRYPWGEIEVQIQVQKGMVADVKVYSDSLDSFLASKLELALAGCKMSQAALQTAVRSIEAEDCVKEDLCALIGAQQL